MAALTLFHIVPERSELAIDARSSVHPIRGRGAGVEGTLEASGGGGSVVPVRGRIELAVDALTSGNPLYDGEMRRRVESRRFPVISAETLDISPAETAGRFRVVGEVTFHGVTEKAEGEVDVRLDEDGLLHVEGEQVIDVRRFGINPPRIMMLRVYPDVRVALQVVARPAAPGG